MPKEKTSTTPERETLLGRLADPFDPAAIKWRVTHMTKDGNRGAVIAFADPRAYTDRLNAIFSPTGWTRSYDVVTVSAVSRLKRDRVIATGKVLVTCTLTIHSLGAHTGSGEEWADEQNAMTSAEAQAFKRACTCFGLGRYLYNFAEMWVPLNEYHQPREYPTLPKWALPTSAGGNGHTEVREHAQGAARGPIDSELTTRIESLPRVLGLPIYRELLWRIARAKEASKIPNAELQADVLSAGERAIRGVRRANAFADTLGEMQFIAILDSLQIGSMATIPNLDTLKRLVHQLESCAEQIAA